MEHQDLFKKHSDFIWDIANLLRGPYRPPQGGWQAPASVKEPEPDKEVA